MACKSPLDTTPTNSEDVLQLEAKYNQNKRIIDTLIVKLNWSEITLENFKEIKLTRFNEHRDPESYPEEIAENGWITIATITDEFKTSWIDTVKDDAVFKYRVDFYNQDNDFRRAETVVTTRPTTHYNIPLDLEDIKIAVESYVMDDGDTVFVQGGLYHVKSFSFKNKSILLTKLTDSGTPVIEWEPTLYHTGDILKDSSFIYMDNGTIQGFLIQNGAAIFGGGVLAMGNSQIINCGIYNNTAISKRGDGGGLYLSGNAYISNSIIYNNRASNLGDGIFIDHTAQNVKIINCTIVNNNIYTESSNVQIVNSILSGSYLPLEPYPAVKYSYAGQNWLNNDPTNLVGTIQFVDPEQDFHVILGSVGFDRGNPDPVYNDFDGTRNDIGAYGGPLGNWDFDLSDL
jgi:hypothetical protein